MCVGLMYYCEKHTASSSLHTDLMFLYALVFHLFSAAEARVDV